MRRSAQTDDEDDDVAPVVAIKQFKGLTDMEDEHTRNYVRLTQQREADLALSLVHPNIVRCLGTITAGGTGAGSGDGGVGREGVAFLIFEHVPGTLLDLIQENPGGLSLHEVRSKHWSKHVCAPMKFKVLLINHAVGKTRQSSHVFSMRKEIPSPTPCVRCSSPLSPLSLVVTVAIAPPTAAAQSPLVRSF